MKTNNTIPTHYFVRNPDGSISSFSTSHEVETFFLRLVLNGEPTEGYTLYTATETPINIVRPQVVLGTQKSGRSGPKNRGPNGLPMTKDGREYRPGRRASTPPSPSSTTTELAESLPPAPELPKLGGDFDAPPKPRFLPDDKDVDEPEASPPPKVKPAPKSETKSRRAVVA